MMFLLSLNITTHLRNLRFADREGTVSLLPRKSGGFWEGARNPAGRVRFQLTDNLRECLILPQLCQNVNMIGGSVNDERNSVFSANRSAEIFMNSRADCRRQPWFAVFGRKNSVVQKIAIGGTHRDGPFRRPCSGAVLFLNITPEVPLCSTPRFIPPHPPGALIPSGRSRRTKFNLLVQRRRRAGAEPVILSQPSEALILTASGSGSRATSAPEARRNQARSAAKRSCGKPGHPDIPNPDKGWRRTRPYLRGGAMK
jgi:hypothetical protein